MSYWPDMKFPAINLWSAPAQDIYKLRIELDGLDTRIFDCADRQRILKRAKEATRKALAVKEHIYYLHTGHRIR